MPDIGEGIAEIEIIEWHVSVGEKISPDQVVATIQTDKSMVEMPTPLSGTVVMLGAQAGDLLPIGNILIAVETADDALVTVSEPKSPDSASPANVSLATPARGPGEALSVSSSGPSVRVKAAPSVRRLAMQQGVDLTTVQGSGPGGRILDGDVVAAANAWTSPIPTDAASTSTHATDARGRVRLAGSPDSAEDDEHVPLRGLRRQIAKKMVESWRTVPHITDYREVDATRIVELRASLRAAWPEYAGVLTFVPIFVKVAATALRSNPLMNASFDEEAGEYVLHRRIHIGIATATHDGLLVPVVRDADRKSILELAVEFGALVELTRNRKASLEQLTGGTYTVNNLGAIGASMGTPIIHTPEVGITGFGRIADRVVARDGVPVVRKALTLSSVGDHRLHDGDTLGAFTSTLARLLENPYELLAELA
jgi:pyruvate dehydrogenase E2 component (dihydrolipoamide acetyltransferase)